MLNKPTICAVVVTFNRKALLLNCLNAIKQQTYPVNHIVVIDNASTDGTADFLYENKWVNDAFFTFISLPENSGGAGGFYEGIKYATEQNFDYIWLMDDDGVPSENCLEKLMPYCSESCYIGPMVLDSQTKNKLSFAMRLPNSLQVFDTYEDISASLKKENIIPHTVLPFNGTLISSRLIKKMGLVCKDYFIWGDEREYTLRADKFSAKILTVLDAIFYHPVDSSQSAPMFFGRFRFNNTYSDLKQYCFLRNSIAIFSQYHGTFYVMAFILKTSWFYIFTKPSFSRLIFAWRAMYHGLIQDFTHHKKYLK
ncbi:MULTISPECIES: glycosyltransferase family 2 protein [unclassified Pasteurella]|uniref:glycosyltransferase family 2 protein n=1 Tax=unclassified Pasteurella TaxID=2621516 RepID=UPI00107490FB|nr:glycosyltransferase family 2 protein [Pasteurella sp. 19428wF3_WM03]TFU50627.1 glycosyltransferase [Pasteurella sp. WM03]